MNSLLSFLLTAGLCAGLSSFAQDEKPEKKKKKKPKAEQVDGAAKKAKGKKAAGKAKGTEVGTLSIKENADGKQIFVIKTTDGIAQLNPELSNRIQTAIDRIERGDGAKTKTAGVTEKKPKKAKDKKAKGKDAAKKGKKKKDDQAEKIPAEEVPEF